MNTGSNGITKLSPITNQIAKSLPGFFRLTGIESSISPRGNQIATANLSHQEADLKVMWQIRETSPLASMGDLVEINYEKDIRSYSGMLIIDGLKILSHPRADLNIFQTVPRFWVKNPLLIKQATFQFNQLPDYFKLLINALLWNSERLQRFINGPSSLKGHHHYLHGNFIHTLDVIERATVLVRQTPKANFGIVMMACWLHDLGKADEYYFDVKKQCFELSDRGVLVGHKMTVVEWLSESKAKWNIEVPDHIWLSLIHTLTAVRGAPDWMGLREPVTPESLIVSTADRLSGENDLIEQTALPNNGFGKYHRHLKGRPYLISAKA